MSIDKSPLVSMCMPAYNHAKYIEESILSVIEQDYVNIEFIIINDGSTDNTHQIIKSLENKCKNRFANFIYINRENKGLTCTLNEMLHLVKGKYFMVTASDDTQSLEKVSVLVQFMEKNKEYNCVFSGYKDIDINGNIIQEVVSRKKTISFQDIMFNQYNAGFISYITKADFLREIGGYNENTFVEDLELALRISSKENIHFIDNTLYNHRLHDSNTCTQTQKMLPEIFKILSIYKDHECYEKAYYIWKLRYSLFKGKVRQEFETYILNSKFLIGHENLKYLIYGNGTFGKIIDKVLRDSSVGFIDKDTIEIKQDYDHIIISVLGREEEIVKYLQDKFSIKKDKIIILM